MAGIWENAEDGYQILCIKVMIVYSMFGDQYRLVGGVMDTVYGWGRNLNEHPCSAPLGSGTLAVCTMQYFAQCSLYLYRQMCCKAFHQFVIIVTT